MTEPFAIFFDAKKTAAKETVTKRKFNGFSTFFGNELNSSTTYQSYASRQGMKYKSTAGLPKPWRRNGRRSGLKPANKKAGSNSF